MEEKDLWLLTKTKSWLTGSIPKHQLSVSSMDASGMVVFAWEPPMTGRSTGIIKRWPSKNKSAALDTIRFWFGNALTQSCQPTNPAENLFLICAIIYDFKAVLAKKDLSVTSDLIINSSHILISVTINDSLTREPIFLHNPDSEWAHRRIHSRVRW